MDNVSVPTVGPGGITGRRTTVELCCRPYTTAAINRTIFHANGIVNSEAVLAAERMLDHMVSGMARSDSRPVKVHITVLGPLTATQANKLNDENSTLSNSAAGAAGFAAKSTVQFVVKGPLGQKAGWAAGAAVTSGVRSGVRSNLPYHHAGDIWISAEGESLGGIGPQHAAFGTQIIQRTEYDF